MGNLTLVAAYS